MPLIFTHTSWVPAALCTLLLYFYEGQQSRSSLAQRHEKERERQGKRGGREGRREGMSEVTALKDFQLYSGE